MDTKMLETMLSLIYDAPCEKLYDKEDKLYFGIINRSVKALSILDDEKLFDNIIQTDINGNVVNEYDLSLKSGEYYIAELKKSEHGKYRRDRLIVFNKDMEIIKEYINDDNNNYTISTLDDNTRIIHNSNGNDYNIDGTIIERQV